MAAARAVRAGGGRIWQVNVANSWALANFGSLEVASKYATRGTPGSQVLFMTDEQRQAFYKAQGKDSPDFALWRGSGTAGRLVAGLMTLVAGVVYGLVLLVAAGAVLFFSLVAIVWAILAPVAFLAALVPFMGGPQPGVVVLAAHRYRAGGQGLRGGRPQRGAGGERRALCPGRRPWRVAARVAAEPHQRVRTGGAGPRGRLCHDPRLVRQEMERLRRIRAAGGSIQAELQPELRTASPGVQMRHTLELDRDVQAFRQEMARESGRYITKIATAYQERSFLGRVWNRLWGYRPVPSVLPPKVQRSGQASPPSQGTGGAGTPGGQQGTQSNPRKAPALRQTLHVQPGLQGGFVITVTTTGRTVRASAPPKAIRSPKQPKP